MLLSYLSNLIMSFLTMVLAKIQLKPALANALLGAVLGALTISSRTSAAMSFMLRLDKLDATQEKGR
jgi:hypothetical protein